MNKIKPGLLIRGTALLVGSFVLCGAPPASSQSFSSQDRDRVVAEGVARHRGESAEPFELLRRLGGRELAAIAGAIMAARQARPNPMPKSSASSPRFCLTSTTRIRPSYPHKGNP